jgi:hypothetical protein
VVKEFRSLGLGRAIEFLPVCVERRAVMPDKCEFDDSQIMEKLKEIEKSIKKIDTKLSSIKEALETIAEGR